MKRNMMLKLIGLGLVGMMSMTALASCDALKKSEITVEQFVKKQGSESFEAIKAEVNDAFLPLLGNAGKVEVSVSGNEIIYNMTYSDEELTDLVKESLEPNLEAMREIFFRTVGDLKKAAGIESDILLTVNYFDSKGEKLATRTFYSSELELNIVSS